MCDVGGQTLALVTGRRLPAQRAREEPHEPRSHATLVDNLTVTWEIQHQVSGLPGQPGAGGKAGAGSSSPQVLQDRYSNPSGQIFP